MRLGQAGLVAAFFVAFAFGAARAQAPDYRDVDLGDRKGGEIFALKLGAENRNCPQPIDFRFISKTEWLHLPADPVVRGVPSGQTKYLQATVDLSNVAVGPQVGFIDIDCENCGFLIFKNCKISRQTLRFNVNVVADAGAPPQQPAQPAGSSDGHAGHDPGTGAAPQISYEDERIPKPLRRKAKAADDAWKEKLKKKEPCEEELKKLRAKAAEAKAAAEAAKAAADADADAARKAKEEEAAAKKEYQDASKAWNDAQAARAAAEEAAKQPNRTTAERAEDKAAVEAAKAAEAAAKQRVEDAVKRQAAARQANAKSLEKDAKKSAGDAAKAADAAAAADGAAKAKEEECKKIEEEIAKAKADKVKAEEEAKAAIPVVKPPTAEEIAKARKEANDCVKELGELISAQAKAMQAMASLGALKKDAATGGNPNTYDSDLTDWAKAVDAANDLFGKIPPGVEYLGPVGEAIATYGGAAESILGAIRSAIGVWSGVKYTGQLNLAPVAGETKSATATKDYLKDSGLAGSDKEAADILKQMEKYSETNSTKGMQQELADKKAKCDAMVAKAESMEKAAAK